MAKFKIWEKVHQKFRTCPICGSSAVSEFILCFPCFGEVLVEQRNSSMGSFGAKAEDNNLRVIWAFGWTPDTNPFLSKMLVALKYHPVMTDWQFLMDRIFINHAGLEGFATLCSQALIVPIPGSRMKKDHAFFIAQALANAFGGSTCPALIRVWSATSQRRKTKQERSHFALKLDEKFTWVKSSSRPILLVDDVMTTGFTLKAAELALGRGTSTSAFIIARRLLAPNTGS